MYMIILPYAFLMNTSHNKDKVAEHGWANVIKNVWRTSEKTNFLKETQSMKQGHIQPSKLPQYKEKPEIFATSSSANSIVKNKKLAALKRFHLTVNHVLVRGIRPPIKDITLMSLRWT